MTRCTPLSLLLLLSLIACDSGDADPITPTDTPDVAAPGDTAGDVSEPKSDVSEPEPDTDATEPDAGPQLEDNFGVTETEGHLDCEGLNAGHCLFPYPSDHFRKQGEAGWQLEFGPTTLPVAANTGEHLDPAAFLQHDGYSNITPILFRFEGGSLDGTVPIFDIEDSTEPTSKTLIIDAETGDLVPHWVEHDHFALEDGHTVFTLRPVRALPFGRRFVVAVRGLVDDGGAPIEADPGFAALRDGTASTVKGVHARRARFEAEVFPVTEGAGVDRAELQLAFDFTTASEAHATGMVQGIREEMMEALPEDGPEYTVTDVEDDPHASIARMITGVAKIPSFLLPPDETGLRLLRRGPDGRPVAEGFEEIEFEIQIPHKAFEAGQTMPILQYGHGLFGRKGEAHGSWIRDMANRLGFVVVAIDFQGFSESDVGVWAANFSTDVSTFPLFVEKPMQGLMNHVAIARMMKKRFAVETDPTLMERDGETLSVDASRLYYYGNSQGGTMGSMLMTVHTDITRVVLGVPGGAFAFLLNRSTAFKNFSLLFPFPDGVDFAAIFGLLQTGFQQFEPHSLVHRITDPFPGVPTHEVLLHVAREDAQVHNQASFMLGRTIGAKLMVPAVRPVYGLEEQPYPYEGTSLVEYDFNKPENPDWMYPPSEEHDTHGDLRKLETGQDQLWHFLETGEVINTCEGACDPE